MRIDFDLMSTSGAADYRSFLESAADLVVSHGGSVSGEHGDGQARSELLSRMYPPEIIGGFERFKAAFDPDDLFNPGQIVRPRPLDSDLRVLVAPPRIPTRTTLALHADDGDLAPASRRCVGMGKCLNTTGGVMCPSYRATREEKHSTRGRAHLLFEMLAGRVITGGWRSPEVREALDLCLSCKGCKTDCPVGVDMATYKAEFLHHHYRHRPRPASHYSMGFLPLWLALGQHTPGWPTAYSPAEPRACSSEWAASPPNAPSRRWPGRRCAPGGRHATAAWNSRRWCCSPTPSPTTSTPTSARTR